MGFVRTFRQVIGVDRSEGASQQQRELLMSLFVMAWMVEARDPYTGGHLWRVSQFAGLVAHRAGLSDEAVARITVGGFLHDLGKISVPDHILRKADRLTEEEYAVIQTHPEVGWRLLAQHPLAKLAEEAVRSHHETPDGKGYPRGLTGDAISVDARIVGLCDAFDAMTSTRPYRKGMPITQALSIIRENLGKQFDATLGALFLELGAQGAFEHIVGHSEEGIPLQSCAMCGPIIAIQKSQPDGSSVCCPSCTGEYTVQRGPGALLLTATGRKGDAATLATQSQANLDLIGSLVQASAKALAQARR